MNKEDQILSAILRDKFRLCEKRGVPTWTDFLTPAETALADDICRGLCAGSDVSYSLEGGYEDAERNVCIFRPLDGWTDAAAGSGPSGETGPFKVVRISIPKGSPKLTHRDYLGALLGLGEQRSVMGDILVRPDGADAVVLGSMADYIAQNLDSVGRASASCEVLDIAELRTGEQRTEEMHGTVASLRLDSVASEAFRSSRGRAQEAVRAGLVSVNGRQCLKPDRELAEGDRISVRGKGKAVLKEVGGRTRKDRIAVTITRYL